MNSQTTALRIDYPSKLCKIIENGGSSNILISGKKNIVIPLDSSRIPANGLFLGEHLVPLIPRISNALEVGAGKYAPASFCLLSQFPNISIDTVEILPEDVQYLKHVVSINRLGEKIHVLEGNMFQPIKNKRYELIFSNIAQMPLGSGDAHSTHDHGGEDGWRLLDELIMSSPKHLVPNGNLALMAFEFLGIDKRSNRNILSLSERLKIAGFSVTHNREYTRQIRSGGQTHRSLKYILELYPNSKFYDSSGNTTNPLKKTEHGLPVFLKFHFVLSKLV